MKITISGKPKSGKSSLALLLGEYLSSKGLEVSVITDDKILKKRKNWDDLRNLSIYIQEIYEKI